MIGRSGEWAVRLTDEFHPERMRLRMVRPSEWRGAEIVGFDEDGVPIETSHDGVALPAVDFPGFLVPKDVVLAIAEAIKPGPSQGEARRLEEALALERERHDRIVAALLAPKPRRPLVITGDISPEVAQQLAKAWPT